MAEEKIESVSADNSSLDHRLSPVRHLSQFLFPLQNLFHRRCPGLHRQHRFHQCLSRFRAAESMELQAPPAQKAGVAEWVRR